MSYIKKVKNGEYKTIVQSIEFTLSLLVLIKQL